VQEVGDVNLPSFLEPGFNESENNSQVSVMVLKCHVIIYILYKI
jgi:hypothetical protein